MVKVLQQLKGGLYYKSLPAARYSFKSRNLVRVDIGHNRIQNIKTCLVFVDMAHVWAPDDEPTPKYRYKVNLWLEQIVLVFWFPGHMWMPFAETMILAREVQSMAIWYDTESIRRQTAIVVSHTCAVNVRDVNTWVHCRTNSSRSLSGLYSECNPADQGEKANIDKWHSGSGNDSLSSLHLHHTVGTMGFVSIAG